MLHFLKEFNIEAAEMCNRVANIEWKYATNASEFNKRRMKEQKAVAEKFECVSWKRAATFADRQISDTNTRRQIQRIVKQGKCGLSDDKYAELNSLIQQMIDNYKKVRVCPYKNDQDDVGGSELQHRENIGDTFGGYCDLSIDKELSRLMETSRSEMELRYIWSEWHRKAGSPNRNNFMRYVDLANQAAVMRGFSDAGEQMRAIYEDPEIYFTLQDLWAQIQPLYKQLFTFVRKGLIRQYGEKVVRPDGPIPAHLFGNMYAQNWKNIVDLAKSRYSETPNVTQEMVRQGYTPLRIFQKAEEFFTSLGMPAMSPEFWRNSILQQTRSDGNKCTSSAWDFCNNYDFRIIQCTEIDLEDFIQAHYKVSNVQYYMLYANQPFVYRDGPNPAFHEAIGMLVIFVIVFKFSDYICVSLFFLCAAQAIGLSVGGPVHLQRIGLLNTPIQTANGNTVINIEYLLAMAMEKLPYLAFSLSIEKWRWHVFEKGPVGLNARWWELRLRYQGVVPPIPRHQSDFDAGAKYHIISDQDYIKYFVGTILQFQIYAELCETINHVGPLHTCDFYRSREAGRILRYAIIYFLI